MGFAGEGASNPLESSAPKCGRSPPSASARLNAARTGDARRTASDGQGKLGQHEPMRLPPMLNGGPEFFLRLHEFPLQLGQPLPRGFQLFLNGLAIGGLAQFPMAVRVLKQYLRGLEACLDGLGQSGPRRALDPLCQQSLLFRYLGQDNPLLRHPAKLAHQPQPVQQPDRPFGRIELPRFDPVPVVMLKSVMEIMITLSKR